MASLIESWASPQLVPIAAPAEESWYAVQTRARHEKIVETRLQECGVTTFLPIVTEIHRWSDRKNVVQLPLSLVGACGEGTPIPDDQLESVRILLRECLPWASHPFLKIGQRVRIRSGALDGMEGVLLSRSGDRTLVISVDAIQRSLAVRVEGYEVEAA